MLLPTTTVVDVGAERKRVGERACMSCCQQLRLVWIDLLCASIKSWAFCGFFVLGLHGFVLDRPHVGAFSPCTITSPFSMA